MDTRDIDETRRRADFLCDTRNRLSAHECLAVRSLYRVFIAHITRTNQKPLLLRAPSRLQFRFQGVQYILAAREQTERIPLRRQLCGDPSADASAAPAHDANGIHFTGERKSSQVRRTRIAPI